VDRTVPPRRFLVGIDRRNELNVAPATEANDGHVSDPVRVATPILRVKFGSVKRVTEPIKILPGDRHVINLEVH
jgi:hypothetical protein